jgi:hypothetical protein
LNPWGSNAHEALRWAYGLLARSETMPNVLGDMRSPTRRRGADMTMLDYRAQGALIRMTAERIRNPIAAAHLAAYYLPRPIRERVQGGGMDLVDRFIEDRIRAVFVVGRWMMTSASSTNLRGFMEVERQYCMRSKSEYRLARAMRMSYHSSKAKRQDWDAQLDELRDDGLRAVQRKLEAKGLVECDAPAAA